MGLIFLLWERGDGGSEEVAAMYQKLLEEDEHDPEILGAYATWLWDAKRDFEAASLAWEQAEEAVSVLRKASKTSKGLEGEWKEHVLAKVRAENLCAHGRMLMQAPRGGADAAKTKAKAAQVLSLLAHSAMPETETQEGECDQVEVGGGEMGVVLLAQATARGRGGVSSGVSVLEKWLEDQNREKEKAGSPGLKGGDRTVREPPAWMIAGREKLEGGDGVL
eukprot:41016-Rhodomonas_salina.3